MGEIFPTIELTKEELIILYDKMVEDLKREYDENHTLKLEIIALKSKLETIDNKLRDIIKYDLH